MLYEEGKKAIGIVDQFFVHNNNVDRETMNSWLLLKRELFMGVQQPCDKHGHLKKLHRTEQVVHKTCGLLMFLGGNFFIEDFDRYSYSHILEMLFRNGGDIEVKLSAKTALEIDAI
jgi:hypothetical protein